MNVSERLALTERVDRASEDEVKRALRYMILNCQVNHHTIAHAIKDGIERFTPAPKIVYDNQDLKYDDEVILESSHKSPTKKEEGQSSSGEDEDIPATSSKHHRSSRRRDKKTKNKLQGKSKESSEHDVSRRASSKNKSKKKHKHAPKHQVEGQQNTSDGSMEGSSKRRNSTVIDLVTSSDLESREREQPRHPSPDKPASDDDLDLVNSSEYEPSYPVVPKNQTTNSKNPNDAKAGSGGSRHQNLVTDSSDDSSSEDEQDGPIARVHKPPQGGSGVKSTPAGATNGDGARRAQSVTVSAARASSHHENIKADSLGPEKKRKAPDLTVEDVHTNQPVNPTPLIHVSKRPKQNYPEEVQESQRGLKCDKCEKKFSIHDLVKHRWICKGKAAQDNGHQHVSEAPANDLSHRPKPTQKAGDPVGDSVTAQPQNTMQPPSRPVQTDPAGRELSMPPPSFVQGPNRLARGPTPTPMVLARLKADTQPLPSDCAPQPKPVLFPFSSPGNELQPPKRDPPVQGPVPDVQVQDGTRCVFCPKWFKEWENHGSACRCHTGM